MGFRSNPTLHSSEQHHATHCNVTQTEVAQRSAQQRSGYNTVSQDYHTLQSFVEKPAQCLPLLHLPGQLTGLL